MLLLDGLVVLGAFSVVLLADAATNQTATRRSGGYAALTQRRPLTRQLVAQCSVPYFPNGEAKIRNRGRMIRFDCTYGFRLVGNRYSNCNNGRWDTSIPVCVKSGCAMLPKVDSGFILYELNKATAWLSCFEGTELAGSRNAYCNGMHWDRPLGVCRRTGQTTATTCDFEAESLCGWANDALHDFDWKRSDGTLNPRALRTGPKYDHTKMQPKAGHFMIVDSAEQMSNDTARFTSPMFEPELSIGACFQFYYHMYGEAVGTLKVYVKPMTADLYDLKPSFEQRGNQKNVWHEGHVDIATQTERFQIVFEASLGLRYKSDIAIDDVSLLQGDSCRVAVEDGLDNPEEPPTDPEKVPVKIDSCENRCGSSMGSVLNNTDTIVHCDCHEDCVINATCCPDYRERCVFEVVVPSSNQTVVTTTSTAPEKITNATAIRPSSTTQSTVVPTSSTTATTTSSTVPSTVSSTTPKIVTTKTTPAPTTKTTSTTPRTTVSSSTSTSTTKTYNLRPRPTFVPMTLRPRFTTSTTVKPTTTSTTKSLPSSTVASTKKVPMETTTQSDMVFPVAEIDTTTDGDSLASGMAIAAFPPETIPAKPGLMKFFIFAAVGMVAFAFITCVTYNYVRKSRTGVLARLKEKSEKKYVEDIRFLAGEEDLDFNISTATEAVEAKEPKQSQTDRSEGAQEHTNPTTKTKISKKDEKKKPQPDSPRTSSRDGEADYDSECELANEDGETGACAKDRNPRSTKKAYQKYAKYYDEDMTSTLL